MDKSVENVHNLSVQALRGARVLGIMAKEPRAGQVKTRLCPPLSPSEAAELYRLSLEETVARMCAGDWLTLIFFAGDAAYFQHAFPALPLIPQRGADLGARLLGAFDSLFDAGAHSAVLMGSDSPDLPPSHVAQAFDRLQACDAVLAPAHDGGYVLIGQRRACAELFENIPWSSPDVLSQTRLRARQAGLCLAELAPWEDLDDLAGLRRLVARSPESAVARRARAEFGRHLTTEV